MTDKPQPQASEPHADSDTPLTGTAMFLVVGGVMLLVAAMVSKQWLEARSGYADDSDWPVAAGLFTGGASSAARFIAVFASARPRRWH